MYHRGVSGCRDGAGLGWGVQLCVGPSSEMSSCWSVSQSPWDPGALSGWAGLGCLYTGCGGSGWASVSLVRGGGDLGPELVGVPSLWQNA